MHAVSCFAVVACRNPVSKRWLAVQETPKHDCLWWLPAGRVEQGETFFAAALRETREEAGIDVELKGILRVEHSPMGVHGDRMRVIFYAEPMDASSPLKSTPDSESLGAVWTTVDELARWDAANMLRSTELLNWASYVEGGGAVAPLSVLGAESSGPPLAKAFTGPKECRLFYRPTKPQHRYTPIPTTHVEERTDVYISHSAEVGIKFRCEDRLEIKVRLAADGDGWEGWAKHRCSDADVVGALERLQVPPLPPTSTKVVVHKRRVVMNVGNLYAIEETDIVVSAPGDMGGELWKSICVEGDRAVAESVATDLLAALLDENVVVCGYPAFVADAAARWHEAAPRHAPEATPQGSAHHTATVDAVGGAAAAPMNASTLPLGAGSK
ncbi:hydrolase, NUDIX domain containing protein [Achlya hypogyna]|uniref:Hydrolase, NUDIX domain containing protein n=1 Tax=Achlya hypogyna TaxID=1202772 RepID=A0A1V9YAW0_ACHHY|nr:hydrolase, NUDIX domain containing protein [Achlya hypogyna]